MADSLRDVKTENVFSGRVVKLVDRVKKEEDEEQWISGEELYTEGSSDEETKHTKSRREHKGARPKVYKENFSSQRKIVSTIHNNINEIPISDGDSNLEEPVISWKPKRGSIKLTKLLDEAGTTAAASSSDTIME